MRVVAIRERVATSRAPASKAGEERQSRCASRRSKHSSQISAIPFAMPAAVNGGTCGLGRQGCSGDTAGCSPQRTMSCDEMRAFSKEQTQLDFPCSGPTLNMRWCNGVR